jgi:hypothetical protein
MTSINFRALLALERERRKREAVGETRGLPDEKASAPAPSVKTGSAGEAHGCTQLLTPLPPPLESDKV